jgi:hypothetical protein
MPQVSPVRSARNSRVSQPTSLAKTGRTAHVRDAASDAFSRGDEGQTENALLSTNESCQCIKSALSMLEAISIHNISITRPGISRTLHLSKRILARCKRLSGCEHCTSSSSFVVLLVVVSKNLVDAYEQVLELLVEQFNEQHAHTESQNLRVSSRQCSIQHDSISLPPRQQHLDEENLDTPTHRLNLHGYEFDVEEEPAVFGGVTRLQLSLLQRFLLDVCKCLSQWNREAHLLLVEDVLKRIKELLGLFGTRPGRIFDRQ